MSLATLFFFGIATAAIVTALLMVTFRNPVMSAIALIGNFFCLALLYLLLQAQLLAVLQIIVYTGAIMVLVVFVIMLLNLGDEQRLTEKYDVKKIVGVAIAAGFVLELLFIFLLSGDETFHAAGALAGTVGTVEQMGSALFGSFLLPFEVTSLLLLAAIIGAVVLARRRH